MLPWLGSGYDFGSMHPLLPWGQAGVTTGPGGGGGLTQHPYTDLYRRRTAVLAFFLGHVNA